MCQLVLLKKVDDDYHGISKSILSAMKYRHKTT